MKKRCPCCSSSRAYELADGRRKCRDHINDIEGFWSYAKNWLYPYRGIPTKFFHLCLAEVCWRFNHRDEDPKPLPKRLLTALSTSEINPILVRKAEGLAFFGAGTWRLGRTATQQASATWSVR